MAAPVDPTDPCARALALGVAYQNLLIGGQEQRIRFRNGDTEEDVTFAVPNIEKLRLEWLKAQAECAAKTSGRPARFCAIAG